MRKLLLTLGHGPQSADTDPIIAFLVYRTIRGMNAALRRRAVVVGDPWFDNHPGQQFWGMTWSFRSASPRRAKILIYLSDEGVGNGLGSGLVAHEVWHAVLRLLRDLGLHKNLFRRPSVEEAAANLTEILNKEFWKWYQPTAESAPVTGATIRFHLTGGPSALMSAIKSGSNSSRARRGGKGGSLKARSRRCGRGSVESVPTTLEPFSAGSRRLACPGWMQPSRS